MFLLQRQEGSVPCDDLPLSPAAPHAREAQGRHRGNQTGPGCRRFQEEPGRLRPAGSGGQLTVPTF